MKVILLPIHFCCPYCGQVVKTLNPTGDRVGCACVTVSYDQHGLAGCRGIIPTPAEILPKLQAGENLNLASITEETAFRWGCLVERLQVNRR